MIYLLKTDMTDKQFQELTTLLFATRQLIRREIPVRGAPDPNAWMHFETMRYIKDANGPTMLSLAEHLRVTAPSTTSLIQHLAKRGLVVRRALPTDKRVVRIYLSAKGRAALAAYTKRASTALRAVFSRLKDSEVAELAHILRRVRDGQ